MFSYLRSLESFSHFLRSSGLVFLVNIIGAILGYVLLIVVSHQLENMAPWTALNSIVLILGILINGLATEVSRKSSFLFSKGIEESYAYIHTLKQYCKRYIPIFLLASPLLTFVIQYTLGLEFALLFILILNIPVQIFSNINLHFLMGVFRIPQYSGNILIITLSRFIFTLIFLFFDFGIYSLPFGISLSLLIGWAHNTIQIRSLSLPFQKKSYQWQSSDSSHILHTLFANTALQLPFFILPIASLAILTEKEADIFAIFFTIGQILNFGVVSFLSLLVPYTTQHKSPLLLYLGIGFTLISSTIGIFILLWQIEKVLSVFSRSEYTLYQHEMLLYCIAVALFNLLFFIGRYTIGKGQQKSLYGIYSTLVVWGGVIFLYPLNLLEFLWSILGLMSVSSLILFIPQIYKKHATQYHRNNTQK